LCDEGIITMNDLPPQFLRPALGSGSGLQHSAGGGFKERVHAFEKEIIMQAVQSSNGDRQKAADSLGIGLSTLYRKLDGE
jgi:transcriptional regulator of acetoin/glycerol metabolism